MSGMIRHLLSLLLLSSVIASEQIICDRIKRSTWRLLSVANSTQFAWDVSSFLFLDHDGNSIAHTIGTDAVFSSGSASDPEHGGHQGYSVIETFRGGIWGGRSDAMSRRWIGVQFREAVKVGSVRFQQIGQHITESLLVQFWDGDITSWRTCKLVAGLDSSKTYEISLHVPVQDDIDNLHDLVVVNDPIPKSDWTWSIPISLYLTAGDRAFFANGCKVDPRFGLTAAPGHVLMHCPPAPAARVTQASLEQHMERLVQALSGERLT